MITHDELAYAIERKYGLRYPDDFIVAHEIDSAGNQLGLPFILKWNRTDIEKPSVADMIDAYANYAVDYAAEDVRDRRDGLLKQSDWTQHADVPQATRDAWQAYRQALRDITSQPGFPLDVKWPVKPA